MSFRGDERAQAIQIGAVLLFAVLVIAFSLYQAFIVPTQNEQIELDHNVEVQQQLQDLRNAIVSMPGRTSGTGTTISLGTSYPARVVALNPPPPSGRLSTAGTTDPRVNLTITNATVAGETGDVWNGSTRPYNTGGIVYEPDYNQYRDPPTTIYENTLLYNTFRGGNLTLAGQSLISGDRISLVTLNGSLSRSSSASTTVDTQPISSSDRTILVKGNATSPITLNLTTRLSASRWTTLLDDEANVDTVAPAPNAAAVPDPFTRVQITLDPGQYRLQMAKVGVATGASEESAAYLTDIAGDGETITRGDSQRISLEVRDAFNNPSAGVVVNGSVDPQNAGSLNTNVETSDTDGRITFIYNTTATMTPDTHEIQFSLESIGNPFDSTTPENVSVNVTVERSPQTGNASGGGSGGPFNVSWVGPESTNSANITCSDGSCVWDVGASDSANLDLVAATDPSFEGVITDFSVNDTSIGTISPDDNTTGPTGRASTTLTARDNGTISVAVVSGGDGDVIDIAVRNVTGGPSIMARVDDLTDFRNNAPTFVASYDVINANSSFQRVNVAFDTSAGGASGSVSNTTQRGSVRYSTSAGGTGTSFDITYEVIYDNGGGEYVAAQRTISTVSDTQNPVSENDDLSTGTSATLSSSTITDRSNTQNNKVRYRFEYTIGNTGDYSQVELLALNENDNGDSATTRQSNPDDKNVDVNPGGGTGTAYKVGILVYDSSGAVVDSRIITGEVADGTDP
ncbi:putative surface protein, possible component of pili like system [Halorhabdus sp. SVX81]|uniref:hypothetical protein n=1 Tax=Halorhabdus sp. SVX81 TaxID=2978283 RepID=UPI0023D9C83B|nr:hypothetical protein [Halorhabdus sp. SVX81]WEL17978.1 putative surface protein, possible component of pili like system [Halorhabdus sp. SVX81]